MHSQHTPAKSTCALLVAPTTYVCIVLLHSHIKTTDNGGALYKHKAYNTRYTHMRRNAAGVFHLNTRSTERRQEPQRAYVGKIDTNSVSLLCMWNGEIVRCVGVLFSSGWRPAEQQHKTHGGKRASWVDPSILCASRSAESSQFALRRVAWKFISKILCACASLITVFLY